MDTSLNLDTRTGLPVHLRVLAEKYPKADWQGHANFNNMTAFWLDRHLMFRKLLGQLSDEAVTAFDNGPGPRFAPNLQRMAGFFLNQLHSHHHIEDEHYFPQFLPLDARLEQGFEILDADHHVLDHHIHAFADHTNRVLRQIQDGSGAHDEIGRFHEMQQRFATFLDRHLTDEEEIIVPLVLEYGPDFD
ncbi:Hemerythrin HHE cation binding domain-containing protein [Poseidonocella pacifica]|uniref:Hemerythrin HHE cation binding domain-containing protein n=2 Tax=Poseidonocella pacifica TaxID=871651 RepID=A0A1I0XAM3_9RHOB|nr:Hemerythrin HHE cation binding domain-containing protein [Poseidonocella pacifica]